MINELSAKLRVLIIQHGITTCFMVCVMSFLEKRYDSFNLEGSKFYIPLG